MHLTILGAMEVSENGDIANWKIPGTFKAVPAYSQETIDSFFGSIDVLLNNAGYGAMGPLLDGGTEAMQRQFETNVFSIVGVTRLETRQIARASATQRAGRAGRLGPGVCYRLWSAEVQERLSRAGWSELADGGRGGEIDALRRNLQREHLDKLQAMLTRGSSGLPADALSLIGRRHVRSNNSWLHNSQRLVKGPDRCTLMIHPDDAAQRGLATGDLARVASRVGEVEVAVEVTEDVMPGVVSLPHGWGHDRQGTNLTVAQAHAGHDGLHARIAAMTVDAAQLHRRVSGVLYIKVSDEAIISRLSGRLICRQCHAAIELDQDDISAAIVHSAASVGFSVESQTVEIVGLCASCQVAA